MEIWLTEEFYIPKYEPITVDRKIKYDATFSTNKMHTIPLNQFPLENQSINYPVANISKGKYIKYFWLSTYTIIPC